MEPAKTLEQGVRLLQEQLKLIIETEEKEKSQFKTPVKIGYAEGHIDGLKLASNLLHTVVLVCTINRLNDVN